MSTSTSVIGDAKDASVTAAAEQEEMEKVDRLWKAHVEAMEQRKRDAQNNAVPSTVANASVKVETVLADGMSDTTAAAAAPAAASITVEDPSDSQAAEARAAANAALAGPDPVKEPTLGILLKHTRHIYNAMEELAYTLNFDQYYGTVLAPTKETPPVNKKDEQQRQEFTPVSEAERERIKNHRAQVPTHEAEFKLTAAASITSWLELLTTLAIKYDKTLNPVVWKHLCVAWRKTSTEVQELLAKYPDVLNPTALAPHLKPLTTEQVLFRFHKVPCTILDNFFDPEFVL